MKKNARKILTMVLVLCMLFSIALSGCGSASSGAPASTATAGTASAETAAAAASSVAEQVSTAAQATGYDKKVTIAVETYSTTDAEVLAFKKYYVDYLAKAFNVDFIYSEAILDADAEIAFVEKAQAAGAQGVISFSPNNLEALVDKCASYNMYLVMGAGQNKKEEFDKVAGNKYFLGATGPSMASETKAGTSMAEFFAGKDTGKNFNYLIVSGGGCFGNDMHAERTRSALETLGKTYGLTYQDDINKLSRATEKTDVKFTGSNIKITIYPSYPTNDAWFGGIAKLLMSGSYSVVMNAMGPSAVVTLVDEAEKATKKNILLGAVDCLTSDNEALFNSKDSTGDVPVNFIAGKYGSVVGCAFAAIYNAITGNADLYRVEGKAFVLSQDFWYAASTDEYNERYKLATDPASIAYSIDDLKTVIKVFNPQTSFDSFKALTEASSIEAVKVRRNIK